MGYLCEGSRKLLNLAVSQKDPSKRQNQGLRIHHILVRQPIKVEIKQNMLIS